jgi:S1-C subfamily serine protease
MIAMGLLMFVGQKSAASPALISQNVLKVSVTTPENMQFDGTGFLLTKDIFITNHHVLNEAKDRAKISILSDQGQWQYLNIGIGGKPILDLPAYDFVLLRVRPIRKILNPTEAKPEPLSIATDAPTQLQSDQQYYLFGNQNGNGITTTQGMGLITNHPPMLIHCVPSEPGNSGSPLVNESGVVIAIHKGSMQSANLCPHQDRSGYAVSMNTILDQIKTLRPNLLP